MSEKKVKSPSSVLRPFLRLGGGSGCDTTNQENSFSWIEHALVEEGLGLAQQPQSPKGTLVHTILVEDASLNIIYGGFSLFKSHPFPLACIIHSSHEIIRIVTLTIWHDYGHPKINSMSHNGID